MVPMHDWACPFNKATADPAGHWLALPVGWQQIKPKPLFRHGYEFGHVLALGLQGTVDAVPGAI